MDWYIEHSAKGTTWKKHKYIGIKNGRYVYPKKGKKAEINGTGYGTTIDAAQVAGRKTAQKVRDAQEKVQKSLSNVNIGKGKKPVKKNVSGVHSEKELNAGEMTFDLKKAKKKKTSKSKQSSNKKGLDAGDYVFDLKTGKMKKRRK